MDSDGDIDVLASSWHENKLVFYENDGDENFTERIVSNSVNGASIRLFVCKKNNKKYDSKKFINPMNKLRKMEKCLN